MKVLPNLFENNKKWAKEINTVNPNFFKSLTLQQAPQYLWIGCSDSRVPANQIVGLLPGELFVHRNVGNIVAHSDLNCLSVVQFAVDVLKVKHIIICGHYGCGGVLATLRNDRLGLVDNWLRIIQDVKQKHVSYLSKLKTQEDAFVKLCELNVIEQVLNICQSTVLQDAWFRKQKLTVHGWIYGLNNGLLKDLHVCVSSSKETEKIYNKAIQKIT